MPPNGVILASGAAVAVTVAVAAAIALYESPELRRYAEDLRRRIAIAMTGVSDGFNPNQSREPIFNRPEDAHGFMVSGAEPGVEADEESRRRQREELMYWNSVMMEKRNKEKDAQDASESEKPRAIEEKRPEPSHRGSSFDDFLTKDASAEEGTFVFNSGADVKPEREGLRHRGDVNRGIASALLANPFADEFGIGSDDFNDMQATQISNQREEILSDIYSATTRDPEDYHVEKKPEPIPTLIDVSEEPARTETSATLDRDDDDEEYMTASQRDDEEEAYASIQAWAQNAAQNQSAPAPSFYSPLPVTPQAPISEPDVISDGQLTPTDSVSIIGSGEAVGDSAEEENQNGRVYDVMSESEGMATPAGWSEVGSVVSEYEVHAPARA